MKIKKTVATLVLIKKVCLFIFFLCSFAFANNQIMGINPNNSQYSLKFETKLFNHKHSVLTSKNITSNPVVKHARANLSFTRKLDPSILYSMEHLFDEKKVKDHDLLIAAGVQPKVSREDWEINSEQFSNQNQEEELVPYAGEFTPNTEEENNIILASMLIIFTGAAIIAILSYI